jgi:hypothetical protein
VGPGPGGPQSGVVLGATCRRGEWLGPHGGFCSLGLHSGDRPRGTAGGQRWRTLNVSPEGPPGCARHLPVNGRVLKTSQANLAIV